MYTLALAPAHMRFFCSELLPRTQAWCICGEHMERPAEHLGGRLINDDSNDHNGEDNKTSTAQVLICAATIIMTIVMIMPMAIGDSSSNRNGKKSY